MTEQHPPTPPAIPNDAKLTGGTAAPLYPRVGDAALAAIGVRSLLSGNWPIPTASLEDAA